MRVKSVARDEPDNGVFRQRSREACQVVAVAGDSALHDHAHAGPQPRPRRRPPGPLTVFPILGRPGQLAYRSFTQAIELGAFVKELDGGASVGDLRLENPTDLALLVYEGEEVLGAQQNRSFDASVLVAAGHGANLHVSCVEHGRWDSRRHGEHFAPVSAGRRSRAAPHQAPRGQPPCRRGRHARAPTRARSGARSASASTTTGWTPRATP